MTLNTREGASYSLILAILAFMTFICGYYYGQKDKKCMTVQDFEALMTTTEISPY